MNKPASLPQGFEALEPFVEFWAADTTADRARCRDISSDEMRRTFYDAIAPLVPGALELLDQKPLADFDEGEKRLMKMVLSFAHAAMAVELQRDHEDKHTKWRPFMRITTTPGDMPSNG